MPLKPDDNSDDMSSPIEAYITKDIGIWMNKKMLKWNID